MLTSITVAGSGVSWSRSTIFGMSQSAFKFITLLFFNFLARTLSLLSRSKFIIQTDAGPHRRQRHTQPKHVTRYYVIHDPTNIPLSTIRTHTYSHCFREDTF